MLQLANPPVTGVDNSRNFSQEIKNTAVHVIKCEGQQVEPLGTYKNKTIHPKSQKNKTFYIKLFQAKTTVALSIRGTTSFTLTGSTAELD